jgi:hypothetical protein
MFGPYITQLAGEGGGAPKRVMCSHDMGVGVYRAVAPTLLNNEGHIIRLYKSGLHSRGLEAAAVSAARGQALFIPLEINTYSSPVAFASSSAPFCTFVRL